MKAMRSKPVEEERFEGVFGDTQNSLKFSKSNQLTNIPKWLFFWTICWISQNKLQGHKDWRRKCQKGNFDMKMNFLKEETYAM